MTALALLGAGLSSYAGSFSNNFDADPSADLVLRGTSKWRPTGGKPPEGGDSSSSGYLSITDALNGQSGKIVFDDFDGGKIVAGFTFNVDLRTGGGTTDPADGYSINYARSGDGSLDNDGNPDGNDWASSPTGEGNLPEEGVKSGLSICLDEWFSGGADVIGITVRSDNAIIFNKGYATKNGAADDRSSLQTGPASRPTNPEDGSAGVPFDVADHGWAHLMAQVTVDGKVTVEFKGERILDGFATPYGPSAGRIVFAGRTGGSNAHHHADNVDIVTIPAEFMVVGGAKGGATKYSVAINDSVATGSILDPATATFLLDGAPVTPVSTVKVDDVTTFSFELPAGSFFDASSVHNVTVSAKDGNGVVAGGIRQFTVPGYTAIPASFASGIDPASAERGWKAAVHWQDAGRTPGDANWTVNAERQIANGYLDVDGNPVINKADPAQIVEGVINYEAGNIFLIDGVVNMDQGKAAQGNFRAPGYPEAQLPGVATGDPNNIAIAFAGYVELQAGFYTFAVNSDDGFRHSFGRGLWDVFGTTVGEFNGGRGASDTTYNVVVKETGLYPIRVLWWEGGGGANVEIFSIDENGVRHLLNDDTDPASLRVYRSGAAKSHIASVMPVNRQFGGSQSESPLIVNVVDGAAPVGAITLTVDGVVQAPAVSKEGDVTTLRVDYPAGQIPGTHVVTVAFDDVVQSYDYNVAQLQRSLGTANFVIEAEDFNNNGETVADVNTMPYLGGALAGASAVKHLDFFDNDGDDANNYRTEVGDGANDVNMDGGGSKNRGSWDVTTNFKIGWIGDDYFSYKRTIPAGTYMVVSAQSFDSANNNDIRGTLFVGSTPAMDDAVKLGTFNGVGTRGWGIDNLVAMKDSSGNIATVTLDGSEKNFRFHAGSGDFNYFAFVPTSDAALGPVASVPTGVSSKGALNITITDRVGKVDAASVALKIDGAAAAVVSTANASGASVVHTPGTAYGAVGSTHTYELTYKDTAANSYTKSGSLVVVGDSFYIEAEDYNYGGGSSVAKASVMPYYGGAYDGLNSIQGIDLNNADDFSANNYRFGEVRADGTTPTNVNMDSQTDADDIARDGWTVTTNYKIGWLGGGDWMNYTRTFPAGNYEVKAALSFDGRDANQLSGELLKVTGDITAPGQTTELLGHFRAPGSGGWGNSNLVPLRNDTSSDGIPAIISLGGPTTLRFVSNSGDFDHIKLTPTNKGTIAIANNGDGTVTVTWTAAGALFSASKVEGPYAPVPGGSASGVKLPLNAGGTLFLRVQE